jgi:hypothetical protein
MVSKATSLKRNANSQQRVSKLKKTRSFAPLRRELSNRKASPLPKNANTKQQQNKSNAIAARTMSYYFYPCFADTLTYLLLLLLMLLLVDYYSSVIACWPQEY